MSDTVLKVEGGQQIAFVWEHEGKKCPFIHFVDPKLIKGYSDYCGLDNDFRTARECFTLLNEDRTGSHTLRNSLLANAIVTYGRTYTDSKARSVILDPNQVYAKNPSLKATHDWIMSLRHEFFAHAGITPFESNMVYLALHPDKKSGPLEIYRGIVKVSSFESHQYQQAIAAIDQALDWIKGKIDKSYSRIKELLWKEDVATLYAQAKTPESLGDDVVQVVTNRSHPVG